MDLKSIMNDSAVPRPPRIHTSAHSYSHTPQSSYDARSDQTPSSVISSARPTPYGPPSQSIESRIQGGPGGGSGGYFPLQSPHPNTAASATTPNTGPLSAYSQSPSAYPLSSTPKDGIPLSYNSYSGQFVSPSTSVHHPQTPGSASHPGYHRAGSYNSSAHTPNYQHFQSPPPPQQLNGIPSALAHARQISPTSQFQNQPATPLGPPINYTKISPQSHRPLSQGQELHLRRGSQSSVGSVHSQQQLLGPADHMRRDSVQKSYTNDLRERERSISVSPKTILRAPPSREQSMQSRTSSHGQPSLAPQPDIQMSSRRSISVDHSEQVLPSHNLHAPSTMLSSPPTTKPSSTDHNFCPSPAPEPSQDNPAASTPTAMRMAPEGISNVLNDVDSKQSVLKRSASHFSDSPQRRPPKKRLRREDVPIWAHSARGDRKLHFIEAKYKEQHRSQVSAAPQRQAVVPRPVISISNGDNHNSHAPPARRSQPPEPVQPASMEGLHWESTLADVVPYEDLTRMLCEFILHHVRDAVPPRDSFFEIEAKIGQIVQDNDRLSLPVWSETIVNREALAGKVRFDSNMHLTEHQALNEYLNGLVAQRIQERQEGLPRHEILYDHPRENDEFFALSDEGKAHLDPGVKHWIENSAHRSREVKVRRTVDKETGQAKKTIIKTRIADLEIYNPQHQFDYRISISLETDWNGKVAWLIPLSESRGRNKDRMSYRHMMYQVDLTQVTHDDDGRKEHELEIEISVEKIRQELAKLRNGEPTQYEEMIRGLIDNVRLLSRRASAARLARHNKEQPGGHR